MAVAAASSCFDSSLDGHFAWHTLCRHVKVSSENIVTSQFTCV